MAFPNFPSDPYEQTLEASRLGTLLLGSPKKKPSKASSRRPEGRIAVLPDGDPMQVADALDPWEKSPQRAPSPGVGNGNPTAPEVQPAAPDVPPMESPGRNAETAVPPRAPDVKVETAAEQGKNLGPDPGVSGLIIEGGKVSWVDRLGRLFEADDTPELRQQLQDRMEPQPPPPPRDPGLRAVYDQAVARYSAPIQKHRQQKEIALQQAAALETEEAEGLGQLEDLEERLSKAEASLPEDGSDPDGAREWVERSRPQADELKAATQEKAQRRAALAAQADQIEREAVQAEREARFEAATAVQWEMQYQRLDESRQARDIYEADRSFMKDIGAQMEALNEADMPEEERLGQWERLNALRQRAAEGLNQSFSSYRSSLTGGSTGGTPVPEGMSPLQALAHAVELFQQQNGGRDPAPDQVERMRAAIHASRR